MLRFEYFQSDGNYYQIDETLNCCRPSIYALLADDDPATVRPPIAGAEEPARAPTNSRELCSSSDPISTNRIASGAGAAVAPPAVHLPLQSLPVGSNTNSRTVQTVAGRSLSRVRGQHGDTARDPVLGYAFKPNTLPLSSRYSALLNQPSSGKVDYAKLLLEGSDPAPRQRGFNFSFSPNKPKAAPSLSAPCLLPRSEAPARGNAAALGLQSPLKSPHKVGGFERSAKRLKLEGAQNSGSSLFGEVPQGRPTLVDALPNVEHRVPLKTPIRSKAQEAAQQELPVHKNLGGPKPNRQVPVTPSEQLPGAGLRVTPESASFMAQVDQLLQPPSAAPRTHSEGAFMPGQNAAASKVKQTTAQDAAHEPAAPHGVSMIAKEACAAAPQLPETAAVAPSASHLPAVQPLAAVPAKDERPAPDPGNKVLTADVAVQPGLPAATLELHPAVRSTGGLGAANAPTPTPLPLNHGPSATPGSVAFWNSAFDVYEVAGTEKTGGDCSVAAGAKPSPMPIKQLEFTPGNQRVSR